MKKLFQVIIVTILGVLIEIYYLYRLRNGGSPLKVSVNPTNYLGG